MMKPKKITYSILLFVACLFSFVQKADAQRLIPGAVVSEKAVKKTGVENFFQSMNIPDTIFNLMKGKSYKEGCPIKRTELRYILCLHKDVHGRNIIGEMVVNSAIADDILSILRTLYDASYPIERMRLVDYYGADDNRSMEANNSSCFNFRSQTTSTVLSRHAYGMAIDINPLYNPYYRKMPNGNEVIEPLAGKKYLDRTKSFAYKIENGDICHRLFLEHGFQWGGSWKKSKDYQHFEKSRQRSNNSRQMTLLDRKRIVSNDKTDNLTNSSISKMNNDNKRLVILAAEEAEYKKCRECFPDIECILMGVGAGNVIKTCSSLPEGTRVVNIGYAGSSKTPIGEVVKVSESHRLVLGKYNFIDYNNPLRLASEGLPCYTSNDFVTETDKEGDILFDMELNYIAAFVPHIELVAAVKIVSDNLSIEAFRNNALRESGILTGNDVWGKVVNVVNDILGK